MLLSLRTCGNWGVRLSHRDELDRRVVGCMQSLADRHFGLRRPSLIDFDMRMRMNEQNAVARGLQNDKVVLLPFMHVVAVLRT